jgi:hypothetical protein
MDEARQLWRFLAYDSIRRKTGVRAQAWAAYRRGLVERFDAAQKDSALQAANAASPSGRP